MKKLVAIAVALFTMVASVSAYEWKDCWQNYGGGIKENQFIVNVGAGINSAMFDGHDFLFSSKTIANNCNMFKNKKSSIHIEQNSSFIELTKTRI